MTSNGYTAPLTEDEQSEEDREALDQHDPKLVPTMSGALVPEMNRTFAEAQVMGDGSYQHDTHAIPDETERMIQVPAWMVERAEQHLRVANFIGLANDLDILLSQATDEGLR